MFNKVSKISAAVAAALFSSAALATGPTVAPNIEVFMSGAPGQDSAIAAVFSEMCVSGTLDVYTGGNIAAGTNHSAHYCEIDVTQAVDGFGVGGAGMTTWMSGHPGVNPKVLLHKSASGSGYGVNPAISSPPAPIDAIAAMVINNNNCTETPAGSHLWTCTITNPGDIVNEVSDAGVSYVNPELFTGANVPSQLGSANTTGSIIKAVTGLVFGIPVSVPLYEALQRVQGKTVGAIDETNMPSLSKAEVASIMSGRVKNWNQFKVRPSGQGLRDFAVTLGAPAPASTLVNICRRANGSGTQAQMSAIFLHYPCTGGALAPLATSNFFTGPVVFNNTSADNVDTCLHTAGTLGVAPPSSTSPGNNRWAIGVQALVKNFLVGGVYPLNYRFVKIGGDSAPVPGVAPTLANAANGTYLDWVTTSIQWRDALVPQKKDLVTMITAGVGRASTVSGVLNPPLVYGFGQSGYLALDTNLPNAVSSSGFVPTNPVTDYTHIIGRLNDCLTPIL